MWVLHRPTQPTQPPSHPSHPATQPPSHPASPVWVDNVHIVPRLDNARIAVLWNVELKDNRLSCRVYRRGAGLLLKIESPSAVIVSEPFDIQPRALARARALHASLTRRGWRDSARVVS